MLRHTIDCIPTTQPGVHLVDEPIDAAEGEAVVVAFDGADLRKIHSFAERFALICLGTDIGGDSGNCR